MTNENDYQGVAFRTNPLIGNWVKNGEELAIAQTMGEKKISQFTKTDMAGLVSLLGQWKVLLGSANEISDAELIFVCQFIYDNFGRFTLSDVKIAMNMAISGKLDIQFVSQKTISALYISKCLNSFEEYKAKIINDLAYKREKHENQLSIEASKNSTQDEKATIHKEYLVSMYNTYKNTGTINDYGDFIYKWMRHEDILVPNSQDVVDAVAAAQERFIKERNLESNVIGSKLKPDEKSDEEKKKRFAREFLVMRIMERTNVIELLKQVKIEYFK
jgi:hypothetical protein